MSKISGLLIACAVLCFLPVLGAADLEVPSEIYIGEPVELRVNVPDVLVVVNLTTVAVHEIPVPEPGVVPLCFMRACDAPCPPCTSVPQGQIIIANPGDEVLFTLRGHPQESELRRLIRRARVVEPQFDMKIVEREGGCALEFTVTKIDADLTCESEQLALILCLTSGENGATPAETELANCESIMLTETGPTSGVFVGHYQLSLAYEDGKFTVNGQVFALPVIPKASVSLDGEGFQSFDLVKTLPAEILDKVPPVVREGCLDQVLAKLRGAAEKVYTLFKEGKLWVIVKNGCEYACGVKDLRILPPVQLVVVDPFGWKLQGGLLEAGKPYTIQAKDGVSEGCILIVGLGEDCGKIVYQSKGPHCTWTPTQDLSGKTIAVLYLDPYLCLPAPLIFVVD